MNYSELKPMGTLHLILPANTPTRLIDMVDASANAFDDAQLQKCNAVVLTPAQGVMALWGPSFPLEDADTVLANPNELPSTPAPTVDFGHVIAGVSNFELSGTRNVRMLTLFSDVQVNVTVTILQ